MEYKQIDEVILKNGSLGDFAWQVANLREKWIDDEMWPDGWMDVEIEFSINLEGDMCGTVYAVIDKADMIGRCEEEIKELSAAYEKIEQELRFKRAQLKDLTNAQRSKDGEPK
jgi:hypothetical protein